MKVLCSFGLLLMTVSTLFSSGCSSIAQLPSGPPPAAPAGVTAEPGNGQVRLSWVAVPGARSYHIDHYFATVSGPAERSATKMTGITATSAVVSGLANATPYFFVITAVNENGESAGSTTISATPTSVKLPAAAPLGESKGHLTLSWNPVAGATSYNLYYGTEPGVSKASPTNVKGITVTSHTVRDLSIGATYYFVITSVNAGAESAESSEISARPAVVSSEH